MQQLSNRYAKFKWHVYTKRSENFLLRDAVFHHAISTFDFMFTLLSEVISRTVKPWMFGGLNVTTVLLILWLTDTISSQHRLLCEISFNLSEVCLQSCSFTPYSLFLRASYMSGLTRKIWPDHLFWFKSPARMYCINLDVYATTVVSASVNLRLTGWNLYKNGS